jgi:hypothetical protein
VFRYNALMDHAPRGGLSRVPTVEWRRSDARPPHVLLALFRVRE